MTLPQPCFADLIQKENAAATIRKVCEQCKKEFFVRPNQNTRKYCVQRDCTKERHHLKKQRSVINHAKL